MSKEHFIPVIVGTARRQCRSLPVAKSIQKELGQRSTISTQLLDLGTLALPILEERSSAGSYQNEVIREFCETLASATGIVMVSPEYKNGIPGALKNALDFLLPGALRRKPIGICPVSAGGFGGINCLAQLRLVSLALGGFPIPDFVCVSHVGDSFADPDNPDFQKFEIKAAAFLDELIWYCDAVSLRQAEELAN